jgi:alcohol dehydrogenase YqhD (iron-dependent ADH family)
MRRHQLEHIIRAAFGIVAAPELAIIGSQALLGQFPAAPSELLTSIEADVFAPEDPSAADLIDGSIGEGSPFHQTFGYHARGVGPDPARWLA